MIQGVIPSENIVTPPGAASAKPITAWLAVIQKRTQSVVSVRISFFVKSVFIAKPIDAPNPARCPSSSGAIPGRATTSTPMKPIIAPMNFERVMLSPSISGARRATQIGLENSSATSCASGMTVMP